MTKIELFEELSNINEEGCSRWVSVNEFTGIYSSLQFNNGSGWARKDGSFGRKYIVEFDKSLTPGNKIDRIRTLGFQKNNKGSNYIDKNIREAIHKKHCLVLGTKKPEVDHKNGRKNEKRAMQHQEQKFSDFQPLSKAANDAKRQYCKYCKNTGERYDAKQLGYPMSFYEGDKQYQENVGCKGCFWYDIKEFRKHLAFIP